MSCSIHRSHFTVRSRPSQHTSSTQQSPLTASQGGIVDQRCKLLLRPPLRLSLYNSTPRCPLAHTIQCRKYLSKAIDARSFHTRSWLRDRPRRVARHMCHPRRHSHSGCPGAEKGGGASPQTTIVLMGCQRGSRVGMAVWSLPATPFPPCASRSGSALPDGSSHQSG